ncbi:SDR family oxidoreductase [Ramlibacter sp. G-1-2-2]|uniref:SDR family oxidoreductase n=1 Tax=Ramlibacter agri TaxID=2728837 RepID=A0A848HB35_9BURK|nr:SDR family oxidoreductase [Ramlibacter agri]
MNALQGRRAIVTGGSRGLGLAVVRELAARGAQVVVLARDPGRLRDALAGLAEQAFGVTADLREPAQVRRAFAEAGERFGGRLDFLVNNAGAGSYQPVERISDEEIAHQLASNFTSAVYCARSAIPMLRAAGGGVILNVSTEAAQQPVSGLALYGASKAALESFSLALNQELRADRIKSSIVRLGRMKDTGFSKGWDPVMRAEAVARWQAEGRFAAAGEPMELDTVARTIVDLLAVAPGAQARLLDLREFDAGM